MLRSFLSLALLGVMGAPPPAAPTQAAARVLLLMHPRVYGVEVDLPGMPLSGILTVDLDATPPAVTLQIGRDEALIMSAHRTADSLDLVTSHGGNLFVYHLVLEGEKIRGTVTYNGGELKGTVTGHRQH